MTKISVIIPVYNAQDYLERCLDSVCNQTLKDIEIICINDCSTDNSLEILNNYANKYSNLKIIDCKENGGESVARNKGLDIATGEYLAFVDNDDTIDLDFCEKLYNEAKKNDADIAKGNVLTTEYDGSKTYSILNSKIKKIGLGAFAYDWWTAIYKKSLIEKNNILFPEGILLGGDVLFLHKAIIHTNKYAVVDNVYYHYYRREDSGNSKILPIEKLNSVLKIHSTIHDFFNKNKDERYSEEEINFINLWCITVSFEYALRSDSDEGLLYCLQCAGEFLSKSRDKTNIIDFLKKDYMLELDFLNNNRLTDLAKFYRKYKNDEKARFLAKIRYRIKKKYEE